MVTMEGESVFFRDVPPSRLPMLQRMVLHPCTNWTLWKKGDMKLRWGGGRSMVLGVCEKLEGAMWSRNTVVYTC